MSRGKGSEKQINYKIKKSLNFDGLIIEIVQKSPQDVGNVWPTQSDDLETWSSKSDPKKFEKSIICSNCLQEVDFEHEIAESQDVFCSDCYELHEAYNLVLNQNDEIFVYPSELAKYDVINFGDKNKSKIKRTR